MKRVLPALLALLLGIGVIALGSGAAQAAPSLGTRDTAFAPTGLSGGGVYASVIDAQGRLVVAGDFTSAEGVSRNGIARYLPDGTLDTTFTTGSGFAGIVYALAIDSSGDILAGGYFTTYDNATVTSVVRLTPTGALDTTLTTGSGFNGAVSSLAIDSRGTILVGGNFTVYNGAGARRIARLTPDGGLDSTFPTATGFDNTVYSLAIDSSGTILVGGDFTTYDGAGARRIARLTTTGALDTTFPTATGFDDTVRSLAIDSSGTILAGGDFTNYKFTTARSIARLTTTGALDTTLATGTGFDGAVRSVAIDSTGTILAGGDFTTYDNAGARSIARLTTTGALDTTLATGTGFDGAVSSVAIDSTGNILAGGAFTTYDSATVGHVVRLTAPVSLSYDAAGGTGTAPATQATTSGRAVTVADGTGLTRAGYTFNGWNTAADGTGTAKTAGASYTLTTSTTLYAQWTPVPVINPVPHTPNNPTPTSSSASITLVGGNGSIAADAPVTITATGLEPGSTYTVTMHSTPVVLLTGTVPATGSLQTSATLPADVPAGAHRLVLDATAADGSPLQTTTTFTVAADGTITTTSALATTGDDTVIPLTALAGVLLLAGTGAVLMGRRRQH